MEKPVVEYVIVPIGVALSNILFNGTALKRDVKELPYTSVETDEVHVKLDDALVILNVLDKVETDGVVKSGSVTVYVAVIV